MSGTIAYYHYIIESYNERILEASGWDKRLKLYRRWLHSRTNSAD